MEKSSRELSTSKKRDVARGGEGGTYMSYPRLEKLDALFLGWLLLVVVCIHLHPQILVSQLLLPMVIRKCGSCGSC
jgi:hypothetical protein